VLIFVFGINSWDKQQSFPSAVLTGLFL